MEKYQVGDIVRCVGVKANNAGWQQGLEFEVTEITAGSGGNKILWGGVDGNGVMENAVELVIANDSKRYVRDLDGVAVGDEIKLSDYSMYGDYRQHEGKTAKVKSVDTSDVIVVWPDGETSTLYASDLDEVKPYLVKPEVKAEPEPDKPVRIPKNITATTILGQDRAKKHIKIAVKENIPVLLIGDTGTGKTTIVKDIAIANKAEAVRFNLTGETTVEEFVGKYTLEQGETRWQDGVLLQAMKTGKWLIVDEVNVALPEILFVLHSLLDDERAVLVANHDGEIVKPHANFRFFATMNPVDEYAGTKDLNKAFKSRFGMIIDLSYPTPRLETAIVHAKGGIGLDTAGKLVDIANLIRQAKSRGEIFYTCSTRDLLQVAGLSKHLPLAESIKLAIVNKANGDGQRIAELVRQVERDYRDIEKEVGTTNIEELSKRFSEFKTKERELERKEVEVNRQADRLEQAKADMQAELKQAKADLKAVVKKELLAELGGS